jgi:hypothetical protein
MEKENFERHIPPVDALPAATMASRWEHHQSSSNLIACGPHSIWDSGGCVTCASSAAISSAEIPSPAIRLAVSANWLHSVPSSESSFPSDVDSSAILASRDLCTSAFAVFSRPPVRAPARFFGISLHAVRDRESSAVNSADDQLRHFEFHTRSRGLNAWASSDSALRKEASSLNSILEVHSQEPSWTMTSLVSPNAQLPCIGPCLDCLRPHGLVQRAG